jgi:hypothetical protein
MDKADRHTDTACSHNEAKPRESMAQMVSNRHGPTSCRLASIGRAPDANTCSDIPVADPNETTVFGGSTESRRLRVA